MSLDNNSFKSLLEKAFNHQTNEEYSEAERIYKYLFACVMSAIALFTLGA